MADGGSPFSALRPDHLFLARARLLGRFVSFQILAQAIGVICGILLVRTLGRREYALLTIASAMQGTMNLLADTGLSIGLTSIGGRVWRDRHELGRLVATTTQLRRRFAVVAVTAVAPILVWMLVRNGSSYRYAALLTLITLLGVNFQLTITVLGIVPRLLSQISRLQRLDFASAALRLILLTIAYFTFLNAATAVLASVATLALQRQFLHRWAGDGIERDAPISAEHRRELLRIVKHGVPTAIFYCVQGQVSVWLMSLFGQASSVAAIGALSRLSVVFSVLTPVMSTIIVPRFARYQGAALLKRRFIQIITAFAAFGLMVIAASALFPDPILWILGKKYAHLNHELVLMMISTTVSLTAEAMWLLNSAKAWIEHSWLQIPGTLAVQALLLATLKVSTLQGALLFGILSLVPSFFLNLGLAYRGLRRTAARERAALP